METAVEFAQARGLAIAFNVMLKDRAATHLYERLRAHSLRELAHHHGSGPVEPAAVYVVRTPDESARSAKGLAQ